MRLRFIAVIALILPVSVSAQQEMLLSSLPKLPQSAATNPSIPPVKEGWTIGFPSIAFNYGNNAFVFNDLVRKYGPDSAVYDVEGILTKLHPDNIIQYQFNADLLRFAWRKHDWFLSALVTEKMNVKFSYPKSLIDVLWRGNAAYLGDTVSLGPQINAVYYREFSLTAGYVFSKFSVGVRGKLLAGLGNCSSERGRLTMFTDSTDYSMYVNSSYYIKTAGIHNFRENGWGAALSFDNPGYAFDIGITAAVHPKLTLHASVINIGEIRWRDDVKNYRVDGSYRFEGLDLVEYFQNDTLTLNNLADTLRGTFLPREDSASFTSPLVPQAFFSASWQLSPATSVGIVTLTGFFDRPRPAISVVASHRFNSFLDVGASLSWKNKRWANLGLSIVSEVGRLQFYAVSDNVIGTVFPRRSKNVNFRIGINVALPNRRL